MKRRLPAVLVFVVACSSILSGGIALSAASPKRARVSAKTSTVRLNGNGLGVTGYGAARSSATKAISAVLGNPTGHPSADCTSKYFQTAWHDLVVQFVAGRFRGYRYLDGGDRALAPTRAVLRSVRPRLSTTKGISLGSSLADAKRAYRTLRRSATKLLPDSVRHYVRFLEFGQSLPQLPDLRNQEQRLPRITLEPIAE